MRQGEWFAIPVNAKEVPNPTNPSVSLFCDDWTSFSLPIEKPDSNIHMLGASHIVITKNGQIFCREWEMNHEDHLAIRSTNDEWFTFARNTALMSFSAEKVD